jgi:hypothetical protein
MARKKDEGKLIGDGEPGEMVREIHAETAEGATIHFAPSQLSPGLNTSDLPQTVLDELSLAETAEQQRRAGWLNEPGPYDGSVPFTGYDPAGPPQVPGAGTVQMIGRLASELPHRTPGVTEKCPDQGTCHHGCGDGPCFRVLYAGPLSGRYDGDVWPQEIRARHGQLAHDAAPPPLALAARQETRQDGEQAAPPPGQRGRTRELEDFGETAVFRLRSGDVIRVSVDQSSGMLAIESDNSRLMVCPDSSTRIRVM